MKTIYDIALAIMALAWLSLCIILVPQAFKDDNHD